MLAKCSMSGMDFGMPDTCLTPAGPAGTLPIPYPNMAMTPTALPPTASMKVLLTMMPAHNLGTTVPMTMGDNAGVAGGVASGMMMGQARNTMGSFKVLTSAMPATKMLSTSMQNMTNCPAGMSLVPSQFKVLILS